MDKALKLVTQPSSFAGIGIILSTIPHLVVAPYNVSVWLTVLTGVIAILKSDKSND